MEEISLKEIIQMLLKGKYIIIITTVAALVIGAAVYKLLPEEYKTTVSILANPLTNVGNLNDSINSFALPNMDISSYKQQFLNNYTLRQTIEELDLRDNDGNYITNNALMEMVTVENPEKTNILDVDVSGGDPAQIAQIASALSKHFIDYITDVYQTSASVSARALEDQLKIEEANLDREATRLRDYLKSSVNIDTLKSEIASLIGQITQYKASLNDMERAIDADSITVTQLRALAGDAVPDGDMVFNTRSRDYQISLDAASNALGETLYTLKLADVEARLIENTNNKSAVENKLVALEDRLSDLQAMQAEEQYKYNAIQRDFDRAESIYNTYTTQYKQALTVEAANLGAVNIKVISEAVIPVNPNNKNLLLTGGVAGVLGVFIGMFIVLFMGYWAAEDNLPKADDRVVKEYETEAVRG